MILGIGNDIIEIARIKAIMARHPDRFLKLAFTSQEQEYCLKRKEPALHFAGRFAAKEAIVKALGTGFSKGVNLTDFEIHPNAEGKPEVILSPLASEIFGNPSLMVSISHCKAYATAVAIWVKN